MQNKARKNYIIYVLMLLLFGGLIYVAIEEGDRFSHHAANTLNMVQEGPFAMFLQFMQDNLHHPLTTLLIQIIAVLLMVRLFGYLFSLIGQPGVIGEIVAGIVLGPSVLGLFFPEAFHFLFPVHSLTNLELLSQVGLILFMFVIGMELDFSVLKNKINETLVISHAGILVPFFLGILSSYWIYETYAADHTPFLPFALFIGISMSITAFPVLARIIQERNMTKTPLGTLAIASAANDDVTAWCLLAVVIAISKAGSFASALYSVGLAVVYIAVMFLVVRPFLKKVGEVYANKEAINKTFVAFILLILIISSCLTEIIGIHALFGAFMAGVVMPSNLGFRKVMMEKVEDVQIIDSLVVDKDDFLSAYILSEESGTLDSYKDFFQTNEPVSSTVYKNQKGDKIYYAHSTDGDRYCLFTQSMLMDEWGDEKQLPMNINSNDDDNYPFVLSDGATIYYSSKGNGSIGGAFHFYVFALHPFMLWARKEQLKPTILQAEEQLNALLEQPGELEKKARNAEINYLKNKR